MNLLTPDVIKALTPVFLALIGGMIGCSALVMTQKAESRAAALTLASTAIVGAAALAQPHKDPNREE